MLFVRINVNCSDSDRLLVDDGGRIPSLLAPSSLVEEGDFYVMDASLKNMTVNLNGQEMPIPMPGMGGGSPMLQ